MHVSLMGAGLDRGIEWERGIEVSLGQYKCLGISLGG